MKSNSNKINLPIIVEKGEDGFYVVECPLLRGCYTQGETLNEALTNIHEVIEMCLDDETEDVVSYIANIQEFSFHTLAVEV
jgi:predicted RNase H-like HicB family nuclease